MPNESLVQTIKQIVALAREGNLDESYKRYAQLFGSREFAQHKPEDQRQALRLMILAKGVPETATPRMLEAHRAAIAALTQLVAAHGEPADHELLGLSHMACGDEDSASKAFRAGLTIERERNPQSDLCGALMKRVSLL
jgi:hypothetical protein